MKKNFWLISILLVMSILISTNVLGANGNLTVTTTPGGVISGNVVNIVLPAGGLTITATVSNSAYFFKNWTLLSGDCSITNVTKNVTTVTMNTGNCAVRAIFSNEYVKLFPYSNNAYTTNTTLSYGFTTNDTYYNKSMFTLLNYSNGIATNTTLQLCNQGARNNSVCGDTVTGLYNFTNYTSTELAFDNNYSTYAIPSISDTGLLDYSYKFPNVNYVLDNNTKINIKIDSGNYTFSLPTVCINYANTVKGINIIEIKSERTNNRTIVWCNSDASTLVGTIIGNGTNLYETKIIWNSTQNINYNLSDGKYYYAFTVYDTFGNNFYFDPNITVDTTNPQISFTTLTETNNTIINNRKNITISINVTETNINQSTIYLYNSTDLLLNITTTNTNVTTLVYNTTSNGWYYFNSTTIDLVGFTNKTETRQVYIDSFINNVTFNAYEKVTNNTIPYNVFILNSSNGLITNFTINNRTNTVDINKTINTTVQVILNSTGYLNQCNTSWIIQSNYTFPDCIFYNSMLNFTAYNSYTNSSITNFTNTVILGSFNETQTNTTNTFNLIKNQTYIVLYSHPSYISLAKLYNLTNTSEKNNQSLNQTQITFVFRNVISDEVVNNVNILVNDTTLAGHNYTVTNGILTFNPTNRTHNFTIRANRYTNLTYANTFTNQQIQIIDVYLYPILNISIYEEKQSMIALTYFNFSHPQSLKWTVFCQDTNGTEIGTQQNLIPNTTVGAYTLNATCNYNRVKFDLQYLNLDATTTSYYRTLIFPATINNFDFKVFLPDLALGYGILPTTLKPYDVYGTYTIAAHTQVQVTKLMLTGTELITSDYVDAEGKITAYLIQNDLYIITILADNTPTRILGPYSADASGTKVLRLFDVTLMTNVTNPLANIIANTQMTNITTNQSVLVMHYQDTINYTRSVTMNMYNDSCDNKLNVPCSISSIKGCLLQSTTITDPTVISTGSYMTYNIYGSKYMNKSSNQYFCAIYNITDQNGNTYTSEKTSVFDTFIQIPGQFDDPWTFPWIIMLILVVIALGLNVRTVSFGSLLIVFLAILLYSWNWWATGDVPGVAMGVPLTIALLIAVWFNIKRNTM